MRMQTATYVPGAKPEVPSSLGKIGLQDPARYSDGRLVVMVDRPGDLGASDPWEDAESCLHSGSSSAVHITAAEAVTAFLPGFGRCRGAAGLNGAALGQHSRDQFAQRLCVPKTLSMPKNHAVRKTRGRSPATPLPARAPRRRNPYPNQSISASTASENRLAAVA
jgi:hypothetical protein